MDLSEGLTKNLMFLMIIEGERLGARALALPQPGAFKEEVSLVESADDLARDVLEILRVLDKIEGVAGDNELLAEAVAFHPIVVIAIEIEKVFVGDRFLEITAALGDL